MFRVVECKRLCVSAKKFSKYKLKIAEHDSDIVKYIAIFWNENEYPIVYDACLDEVIGQYNWSTTKRYAISGTKDKKILMHILVMKTLPEYGLKAEKDSVDHIDEYQADNRLANLRIATHSQQIANRSSRVDKLAPPQELLDAGITELPRHVRFDKSENKFIIERHPALKLSAVSNGKKPYISGTKSARYTISQKYQDILHKLAELDKTYSEEDIEFQQKKKQLADEYIEITNCVRLARGLEEIQKPGEPVTSTPEVQPEMKTIPGRKKSPTLPPDCGVKVEDIPKYVYYRAENDKRGDVFIIERHPGLQKRQWSTTSSKSVSTREKFDNMLEVYKTLPLP